MSVPRIHRDPGHPYEEFFEPWREARRERYAAIEAATSKRALRRARRRKRRALLTIVHNEAVFLPIWLRYYARFFRPDDIYVLDHETTDGSTDGKGFVRIPVSHETVDHTWMVRTIEAHQHELLGRYDVVLTTDVDEIVAPPPEWGTLGEYIDRFDEEFVNCLGYEVLHLADREAPFDPSRPVLEQRGHWFANDAYDKPLLASVPMRWTPGFHSSADGRSNWEPDLRLIHLHRMDYELCRERHRARLARDWNRRDLEQGWATYNRIVEDEAFERWFYEDSSFEEKGIRIVLEQIPASWRGLF